MTERFEIRAIEPSLLAGARDALLARLRAVLPAWAEAIEVGSTAVAGVIGKGDIDVLVRVPTDRFAEARALLDRTLERNPNQLSNAIYQGYLVDSELDAAELDIAVQLTVAGGPYDDFEAFLALLRADPALREAYNDLKRRHDGGSMEAYRADKRAFIEAALAG